MLSKRGQIQEATGWMIPFIQYFGKEKTARKENGK